MAKLNDEAFEGKWYAHGPMRNALIAGGLTGTAFALAHLGIIPPLAEIATYIVAILIGGYHWTREAIEEFIEERKIGIEMLMLAATVGSAILGLWDEAAFLVFLFGAAEGLEEYAFARTRSSIRKLLDLAPKEARLLQGDKEIRIPATELKIGDLFLVKPGESVATDGLVIDGRSTVNEAPVTGEFVPVEKKAGMKVFAASMNQEGAIKVRATVAYEENTLSKMIRLVEEAQEQKSNTQQFIERFGNRYSPLVLLSAALMVIVPPLFGLPSAVWSLRAVVLLVAAAPCALVMSTPVAITAAISKAGRNGILIKGGAHLSSLGKIKVIAVDKTGTLTRGQPVVTNIVPLNGHKSEKHVLDLAYSLEQYSEHPLAQAIVKKAEETNTKGFAIKDFTALAGYGAKARIGEELVYVGKEGLFKKFNLESQSFSHIENLRNEGKTVILVGTENRFDGLIAIRDEIRPEAKKFVDDLHSNGIKIVMLTGDNQTTAKAVAQELGIDDYRSDLKPEAKLEAIKELNREYGAVAMIGDGINDSPALAQATVGIAMGAVGTDAAIEAADVALMADDLGKVLFALELGKKSGKISLQNLIFSILILVLLIPSALIGIMTVGVAVFIHEISELLAVANGLRVSLD